MNKLDNTNAIALFLLHPQNSTPIQSWTFTDESVIRIGRGTDNHVVLYSAVVSRKHIELRRIINDNWELVSLGANGTYLNEQRISQMPVADGVTIRLAQSGPKIQIRLGTVAVAEELSNIDSQQVSIPAKDLSKETVIGEPFQKYIKNKL